MQTKALFQAAMMLVAGSMSALGCQGDEQGIPQPTPQPGTNATGGETSIPTESATGNDAPTLELEASEGPSAEGSVCGDGVLHPGEECDDSNPASGDGCSSDCKREPLFICLAPGQPCIQEVCGDSVRTASELCDDGNVVAGDGCNATCQLESGWQCLGPGRACVPNCGDGLAIGNEQCDDGNRVDGDGCGAGCLVEFGWFNCPPTGQACQAAICGNAVVEANEGCDDGNDISGDGCNGACQREPAFDATGVALPACGDGAKTLGEECDDGNLITGDGCSDSCTVEGAFECGEPTQEPDAVRLAVMFRDFTDEHPDFEYLTPGLELGIVGSACTVATAATCGALDAEGKPVLNETETFESTHTAADFQQWYRDVEGVNLPFPSALELTRMTEDRQTIYRFENRDFYPLDGEGFGEYENSGHNYHFTTELRYFIQYAGGERLEFNGDDDVWIYVNRRLAVDIGGVHAVEEGFILLGDEDGDGSLSAEEEADPTDDRFGITKGNLYEVHLFHAERHTIWSNFKLTLQNFILSSSVCTPICGNASVEPGESCDDGVELNTGEYGACSPDCSGRKYCGDAIVQSESGEECDDGVNLSPYGSLEGCALDCTLPPRCGDAVLNPEYGETCDLGDERNGVRNSGCSLECQKVAVVA